MWRELTEGEFVKTVIFFFHVVAAFPTLSWVVRAAVGRCWRT